MDRPGRGIGVLGQPQFARIARYTKPVWRFLTPSADRRRKGFRTGRVLPMVTARRHGTVGLLSLAIYYGALALQRKKSRDPCLEIVATTR